jgi:hypothetical protein
MMTKNYPDGDNEDLKGAHCGSKTDRGQILENVARNVGKRRADLDMLDTRCRLCHGRSGDSLTLGFLPCWFVFKRKILNS